MKDLSLSDILKFVELTRTFRGVERAIHMIPEQRYENDAEHSFQLAIVAWYLISALGLKLNKEKVLMYALAHDLVEVYAGDTPLHTGTKAAHSSKSMREHKAQLRIEKEFKEFKDLHRFIEGYERRKDKESTFVYALDKALPVFWVYLEKGHSWKHNNIPLQSIIEKKIDKVKLSPDLHKYFVEVIALLQKNEKKFFNKK